MYIERQYSDFFVASFQPALRASALTRRHVLVGGSAASLAAVMRPSLAHALNLHEISDGVDAVVSVISNVDHLAGEVWPKVQRFFGSGNSNVEQATASRIANYIDDQLQNPENKAVSIADNRTGDLQQGYIRHFYDQDFSQAYVDWCTCNSRVNEKAAEYWDGIAASAEQKGDFGRAQQAAAIAAQDRQNAKMYLDKIRSPIRFQPINAALQPAKPLLTTLVATPQLTSVLDEGDYCVTHAVAQLNRGSGLTRV